ncbi:MAG: hypothetical protein E7621_01720 [Ruminococcaceae bacterium]|nr:hypothetical protein [Oscillospiraceae bacterium]
MPRIIFTSCVICSETTKRGRILKQNIYKGKTGKQELEKRINRYFAMCDGENNELDKDKKTKKPYTLTGLLYYLDMSAKELSELENSSRSLRRIISGAKRRIEAYIEENSLAGRLSATASINSLKEHFGWQTKQEDIEGFSLELSEDAKRLGE